MQPPVNEKEIARRADVLRQCLAEGFAPPGSSGGRGSAIEEAARRLGVSSGALRNSVRTGRIVIEPGDYQPPPSPVNDTASRWQVERQRMVDELTRLRAEVKAQRRAEIDAEQVREAIFGLAARSPEPPAWLVERRSFGSAPGVPVTVWSDWHWGEVVRAEEVSGRNAFDVEIARNRVRSLVSNTIDLCFNHMVTPEYPGIVVCLGGDMLTGDIHDELAQTNDLSTGPALIDLMDTLAWALAEMADRFGQVFVPCVVGNHGRMTHKPRAKGRVHTSYEWLLYCQLERHFRNDPRVRFFIPGEADAHFRVYGHRYLLTHGDALGVKGGDGIIGALGPITRGRIKLHSAEAQIGRDFDTLIIGHWHNYMPLPGCVVNGSLKGFDEYARLFLRAKWQPPIQALWFTHPKRGVTCHWPVFLDDGETDTPAASAEWVSWRAA